MSLSDVIKKGSGAPAPGDLIVGGIGVDTLNKRVYFKAADNSIVPHDRNVPAGQIVADTVQAAINDLDTRKADNWSLGFKNKLINGNFAFWEYEATQSDSGYGSDNRWSNLNLGSTKVHTKQAFTIGQTSVPDAPPAYSRTVVTSVAGASNYCRKVQYVEDVTLLAGKTVTLSFWAKADATKNIAVEFLQYFGTGGSPSASVTGDAFAGGTRLVALTSNWAKYACTVTLPSVAGKVLGTSATDSLGIAFWFDAGSTYAARASNLGQQSGTFDVARAQLEIGPVATPFDERPLAIEQTLCGRYYEANPVQDGILCNYVATYARSSYFPFAIRKRANPTVAATLTSASGNTGTPGAFFAANSNSSGMAPVFAWTGATPNTAFAARIAWTASAELS